MEEKNREIKEIIVKAEDGELICSITNENYVVKEGYVVEYIFGEREGSREMIKHYITKYEENGKRYAESWLQLNIFGRCYCFSRKKIEL